MSTTELGIDEAGRGPVLGPMVLAGVLVHPKEVKTLKMWGVADSKKFGSHAKGKKARA
jgi:ribonuclease HII